MGSCTKLRAVHRAVAQKTAAAFGQGTRVGSQPRTAQALRACDRAGPSESRSCVIGQSCRVRTETTRVVSAAPLGVDARTDARSARDAQCARAGSPAPPSTSPLFVKRHYVRGGGRRRRAAVSLLHRIPTPDPFGRPLDADGFVARSTHQRAAEGRRRAAGRWWCSNPYTRLQGDCAQCKRNRRRARAARWVPSSVRGGGSPAVAAACRANRVCHFRVHSSRANARRRAQLSVRCATARSPAPRAAVRSAREPQCAYLATVAERAGAQRGKRLLAACPAARLRAAVR